MHRPGSSDSQRFLFPISTFVKPYQKNKKARIVGVCIKLKRKHTTFFTLFATFFPIICPQSLFIFYSVGQSSARGKIDSPEWMTADAYPISDATEEFSPEVLWEGVFAPRTHLKHSAVGASGTPPSPSPSSLLAVNGELVFCLFKTGGKGSSTPNEEEPLLLLLLLQLLLPLLPLEELLSLLLLTSTPCLEEFFTTGGLDANPSPKERSSFTPHSKQPQDAFITVTFDDNDGVGCSPRNTSGYVVCFSAAQPNSCFAHGPQIPSPLQILFLAAAFHRF